MFFFLEKCELREVGNGGRVWATIINLERNSHKKMSNRRRAIGTYTGETRYVPFSGVGTDRRGERKG